MTTVASKSETGTGGPPQRGQLENSFLPSALRTLGSLKLTVFLLSLGLVLVLLATLQQTRRDIYHVKKDHFSSALVQIQFQELLPPAWFPEYQDVGGGFLMPSGVTVLVALLLNLFFAHLSRFRLQASGTRLAMGALVMLFGAAITLLVIVNGNMKGFQEEPLISWQTQWFMLQVGMGIALAATLYGIFMLSRQQSIQRLLLVVIAVILAPVLGFTIYKGQDAFIGDDAMRVVWRLLQGAVAATVVYFGAMMVFRRKAGIVVIHSGILLLMVGELYTTYSAVEQRMTFIEGESASHTFNINNAELAIVQSLDENSDRVIVVPEDRLRQLGEIDDPRLPFKIRTLHYFVNSRIAERKTDTDGLAADGLGQVIWAEPIAVNTGTDSEQLPDQPSAYVQLIDKKIGADLGTYLVSVQLYNNPGFQLDSVEVDGQSYQIGLRYQHFYKPYTIRLEDTNRENYVGTSIAQTYSSVFHVIDEANGINEKKSVSMNSPLRYNNETFYQAGHGFTESGREFSTLQVVQNTGWMIPYVSCAFVGIGLLVHFLMTFLGFVNRLQQSWRVNRGLLSGQISGYDRWSWITVLAVLLLFGFWTLKESVPRSVERDGMQLDRLGEVPVVYGGRVQPLDSLARMTLRQLRKRETAIDKHGDKQPAIRWLADVMFGDEDFKTYQVFKIDNPEVLSALSLRPRKSHLYSLEELERERDEIDRLLRLAQRIRAADETKLTVFHKKIVKLSDAMYGLYALRYALGDPARIGTEHPLETLQRLDAVTRSEHIPLSIPGQHPDDWSTLTSKLVGPWLQQLATKHGASSPEELANRLVTEYLGDELREQLFRQRLIELYAEEAGVDLSQANAAQMSGLMDQLFNDPSPELQKMLTQLRERYAAAIDAMVPMQISRIAATAAQQMRRVAGPQLGAWINGSATVPLPALAGVEAAYVAQDAGAFHDAIQQHMTQLQEQHGDLLNQSKVQWELFHNQFAPFYVATALYIAAFVIALVSWIGFASNLDAISGATRRASFWLVALALLVHTIGLIARIYISGRPPVTNLYGSAIFIGWVGVLFGMLIEMITRIGLGAILSCVSGVLTLLVAFSLALDGDTFSVLVAVLDTQFWLSTHVVCITLGYAATFVAGALGVAYILGGLLSPTWTSEIKNVLTKLTYGVTCFALLFSFVGTVLGGLWADDSWGRFWGWDPKENGALMIVLANAILLHARWAGLVRQRGIAMLAIMGSMVTIWSWFAVNELGIGLHSYGLTEGRMMWVGVSWLLHLGLIAAACIPQRYWISNWFGKSPPATAA